MLLRHYKSKSYPGLRKLAERFGVSPTTVHKAIQSCEKLKEWILKKTKTSEILVDPRILGSNTSASMVEQKSLSELLCGYDEEQRAQVIEELNKRSPEERKQILTFADSVDDWDDAVREFNGPRVSFANDT